VGGWELITGGLRRGKGINKENAGGNFGRDKRTRQRP